MSSEHFIRWAESYREYAIETLGDHGGQEHIDNLGDEALRNHYNDLHGATPTEILISEGEKNV